MTTAPTPPWAGSPRTTPWPAWALLDPVNGLVDGSMTKDQWISDVKAASDQMRANIME